MSQPARLPPEQAPQHGACAPARCATDGRRARGAAWGMAGEWHIAVAAELGITNAAGCSVLPAGRPAGGMPDAVESRRRRGAAARAGSPPLRLRLQGCQPRPACWALGRWHWGWRRPPGQGQTPAPSLCRPWRPLTACQAASRRPRPQRQGREGDVGLGLCAVLPKHRNHRCSACHSVMPCPLFLTPFHIVITLSTEAGKTGRNRNDHGNV